MIAGESVGLPHGWVLSTREDDEGATIFVAFYELRLIGERDLTFESLALGDLVDQVLEAVDAWQTELELAEAMRAGPAVTFGGRRAV